ncbi:MAG: hypothetical protein CL606_05105 [Anaerolineaceae bacterium]|nr:hypothetical protein [Anaerolineaceae bacterium]
MQLYPLRTTLVATLTTVCLLFVAWLFLKPGDALLRDANFEYEVISPNADNIYDVTKVTYTLAQPANVSIFFLDNDGRRYDFRRNKPRQSGEHNLLFSGIVNGFEMPSDSIEGKIVSRILPNGDYQWVVEANNQKTRERKTGSLTIKLADDTLPDMRGFSVSPVLFTPNRDGISDRIWINLFLTKEAHVDVFMIDHNGNQLPIAERAGNTLKDQPGMHTFEYEGGVDLGVSPPPDGIYKVIANSLDAIGQKVTVEGHLEIKHGGVPRADIVNADVEFEDTTIVQGDKIVFTLTVENYGASPIRTSGPEPGFHYTQNENSNTHGWYEESGAWRIGIDCDTCIRDYPWRWALGKRHELTRIEEHWYLMPGERATITGAITITDVPARNPLYFWAGLIHEDVEISNVNNRVDPHFITIVPKR